MELREGGGAPKEARLTPAHEARMPLLAEGVAEVTKRLGFDTAWNEPSKVCCEGFTPYTHFTCIPNLQPRHNIE